MNFDVNTLSALMQMLGGMKPPANENKRDNNNYDNVENKDCKNCAANGKAHVQSAFAIQNGLGEQTEIFDKSEKKTQNPQPSNPMSSILEMFTGKTSGSGDAMSSLLPMFMNMMSGKNKSAQAAQTSPTQNAQNSFNAQYAQNKQADKNDNNVNDDEFQRRKASTINEHTKTQSPRTDKFEPIAFAGYTLISALNKLYCYKLKR